MMNATTMVAKVGTAKNIARSMSPGEFSFWMMWDAILNDVDPIKAAIITIANGVFLAKFLDYNAPLGRLCEK